MVCGTRDASYGTIVLRPPPFGAGCSPQSCPPSNRRAARNPANHTAEAPKMQTSLSRSAVLIWPNPGFHCLSGCRFATAFEHLPCHIAPALRRAPWHWSQCTRPSLQAQAPRRHWRRLAHAIPYLWYGTYATYICYIHMLHTYATRARNLPMFLIRRACPQSEHPSPQTSLSP